MAGCVQSVDDSCQGSYWGFPMQADGSKWQVDFARVYAARESCTPSQAGRAASIVCESLCQLPPLDAVRTVLADRALLAALRIATRSGREDESRSR